MSETGSGLTAWVAGASGLIGKQLIKLLLNDPKFSKVIALVRSESPHAFGESEKLEQAIVDWRNLPASNVLNQPVDAVFCALGSTAKKTPDPKEYFRIDVQYPVDIAQAGLKAGAKFFGVVSADGANPNSPFKYPKMKGELERQIRTIGYSSTAIARPGLLMGDRDEYRLGERMGEWVLKHAPGNFRAIQDIDVAASLILKSHQMLPGVSTLSSSSMQGASTKLKVLSN